MILSSLRILNTNQNIIGKLFVNEKNEDCVQVE